MARVVLVDVGVAAMRRFDEAIDYTYHWQSSINMTLLIRQLNSQTVLTV